MESIKPYQSIRRAQTQSPPLPVASARPSSFSIVVRGGRLAGGRGADEEEEPRIYLPEMATGTVMWNVYGGLYAEADLYASLERGMDPHIGEALLDSAPLSLARSMRAANRSIFTRQSAEFPLHALVIYHYHPPCYHFRTKAKRKLIFVDDLNTRSYNFYRIHLLFYALCSSFK